MKYSEFVKNVRKQLNYTQKELADPLPQGAARQHG